MAPTSTIHFVRHGEGYHQLPRDDDPTREHTEIRDASLTEKGIQEAKNFYKFFTLHDELDLICASPLRRAIQTAQYCFKPCLDKGMRILAIADAQEASADLSDTGSPIEMLQSAFPAEVVDLRLLKDGWWKKDGDNTPDDKHCHARAEKLRRYLKKRPEQNIVLVGHGKFFHFMTGNIDAEGHQTGEYWTNLMWRSYRFEYPDDANKAHLIETADSMERHPPLNARYKRLRAMS